MHNPLFLLFPIRPEYSFLFGKFERFYNKRFRSGNGNVVHGYSLVHDFDPKSKYEKFEYNGMNKLLNNLPATKSRRKKATVDSSIIDLSIMFLSKRFDRFVVTGFLLVYRVRC